MEIERLAGGVDLQTATLDPIAVISAAATDVNYRASQAKQFSLVQIPKEAPAAATERPAYVYPDSIAIFNSLLANNVPLCFQVLGTVSMDLLKIGLASYLALSASATVVAFGFCRAAARGDRMTEDARRRYAAKWTHDDPQSIVERKSRAA